MLSEHSLSENHARLAACLAAGVPPLIIQDLDGVCMGLVADPLRRTVDPAYVSACRRLRGHFFVLTNGEHVGSRGMKGIVERSLGGKREAAGCYLPGLAAGGVQWQDADGVVSHPGVSAEELRFLADVPARARRFLTEFLGQPVHRLASSQVAALAHAAVLDNRVSPTVNINVVFEALAGREARYRDLQRALQAFMTELLDEAAGQGLRDAFFVHLAPNHGRVGDVERLAPASDGLAGTTDFQFMLSGAIKEAGVLDLLNRHYARHTGRHPLGADFNVRTAPRVHDALLDLAEAAFERRHMPPIVGVGDTVTSSIDADGRRARGGSDRGFLHLVQELGRRFGTDNAVLLVDSGGGEVRRPVLARDPGAGRLLAEGITDADDPLRLNFVFPGGHRQYVDFLIALAGRIGRGADA
ncbi:MAG: glucosylglycerol 3-phosphatase [Zoogloeaceae bacterium]|nr:glucosylglycerol 3-phosphatase [Rhodocyclaceae bacterium]MCP5237716.1 glucosylglycerol 3-phosphatase [Zoogloeaceae bacterium]